MKDAFGAAQTVLVLGGTSEIGLAVVRALPLSPGALVVLAGRTEPAPLPDLGPGTVVRWAAWDAMGPPDSVRDVLAGLDGRDLDVVVAAAGVLGEQSRAEQDPGHAAQIVGATFAGLAPALLTIGERLREQGHGTLVVLSSVAGLRPRRANFVYGAAKAGLDALATGLGDALAGSGARVVVVRPGFVRTRMTAGMRAAPFATTAPAVGAAVAAAVRSGRDVVYVPAVLQALFVVLRALPRRVFRRLPG